MGGPLPKLQNHCTRYDFYRFSGRWEVMGALAQAQNNEKSMDFRCFCLGRWEVMDGLPNPRNHWKRYEDILFWGGGRTEPPALPQKSLKTL